MSDLFLTASRQRFRYPSNRGELTTEQLWEVPLSSKNGFSLNAIAISVNAELKSLQEESFVEISSNPRRTELENMLELIKFVIATKQQEQKAATDRAAAQALKRKIQDAIAAKKDEALLGASVEELEAQLAALG
jgi:hypothetical protein